MLWGTFRKILFLFNAESIHDLSCFFLRLFSIFTAQEKLSLRKKTRFTLGAFTLDSPLGLAAGFDKHATMIPALRGMGFGFLEVGSVTLLPQEGNPKPRLFRLPHSQALINRMGFNSVGADLVAKRLARLRSQRELAFPVGVNLGKNRETPLERAGEDYVRSLEILYDVSDYLVVNLSSPNTPSLTNLQEASYLRPLLQEVRDARDQASRSTSGPTRPLFLKISPDLTAEAQLEAVEIAMEAGFEGIIASNTSRRRDFPRLDKRDQDLFSQEGGLSGKPLVDVALDLIPRLRAAMGPKACLISAGGLYSAADGEARLALGASLLQVYTGFIYGGPSFPKQFQQLR